MYPKRTESLNHCDYCVRYGGLNPVNRLEGIHKDYTYWLDATVFTDTDSFERYITRPTALATQVSIYIYLLLHKYIILPSFFF